MDLAFKEIAKLALDFSISRDSDSNDKSTSQNVSTYAQLLQKDSRMRETTKSLVIHEQSSKLGSKISLPFNDSKQEQQIIPQNTKKLAESLSDCHLTVNFSKSHITTT